MTFLNHIKVQTVGILGAGGGDEIWTCGMTFNDPAGEHPALTPTQAQMDTLATATMNAWSNLLVTNGTFFTDSVGLTGAKAYLVGHTGKSYGPIGVAHQGITVRGAANGVRAPFQIATVVTHDAGTMVRKGRYGRAYLPPIQRSYNQNGFIADDLGPLLDAYKACVDSIAAATATSGVTGTAWSLSVESKVGTGSSHKVVTLSMGNVADTQRRRRNKMIETRISTPAGD